MAMEERELDEYEQEPEGRNCWYCGGNGWGIVGVNWDTDDAINGPYDGEIEKCPCCNGTGRSEDCTFW